MNILRFLFFLVIISATQVSCESGISRRNKFYDRLTQKKNYFPVLPKVDLKNMKKERDYANRFFHRVLGKDRFNGQFLVAKNGKVIYYQVQGYSNYRTKKRLKKNSPMHVASVSKVATSLCVLRLADAKKIDLDADVRKYLPTIPYEGITVRMLLNHRSGIPYYGYFTYNTWHLGKTLHNHDVLKLIQKHKFPLNFYSDKKFAYCNTNYSILALIVEKVTGKKFPKAMQEWIFEPLKMRNTFILDSEFALKDHSRSYNSRMVEQRFDYLDAVYGDKNMYTTALDLLNMDLATYSENFLSDSLKKQMFKGYSYEYEGMNNYGLGIRIKEKKGMDTFYFHSGWWHGNTACYASLRSDTICIIALSNVYTKSVFNVGMLAVKYGNYPYEYEKNPLD